MGKSDPYVALGPLGTYDYKKLLVDGDGNLLTSATGEFSLTGLSVAIKTTTMNVGDTATAIPATPLTGRNSITIVNYSTTEILYIGNITVTADRVVGITSGYEVNPGEGFNLDITEDIVLYGRAETGQTILIKVTEVA